VEIREFEKNPDRRVHRYFGIRRFANPEDRKHAHFGTTKSETPIRWKAPSGHFIKEIPILIWTVHLLRHVVEI
jgi:hypothetical protein